MVIFVCHAHSAALQLRRVAPEKDAAGGNGRRMFIFGLGYTGLAVANQLQKRGWCAQGSHPSFCTRLAHKRTLCVCADDEPPERCQLIRDSTDTMQEEVTKWYETCAALFRHVEGTCRSEEKREVLRIRGFTAHPFNPDDDEGLRWVVSHFNAACC